MIDILVVDDDKEKAKKIASLLSNIPEIGDNFHIVSDLVTARRSLSEKKYDLLLLDLNLPQRYGDDAQQDSGVKFLEEINRSVRLIKPTHIVGLSAFDELINIHKDKFEDQSWSLVRYSGNENGWEKKILNKIEYLLGLKREYKQSAVDFQFDLAIVTALYKTELEAVLRLNANWKKFNISNDATDYYKGIFTSDSKRISVVAAACPQMGMVASAVLTTKMIENFRPKYISMTGISAGIEGKNNFGDILIADIAFDSGGGKIITDETTKFSKLIPDYQSISLEVDLKEKLNTCILNRDYLDSIYRAWPSDKPSTILSAQLGPFASGAGVVENSQIISEIQGHSRKLIGIDMEVYGVYYAAKHSSKPRPRAVLAMKAVSDFANPEKNDKFQNFAAYTSASYLYNFSLNEIDF